MIQVTKAGKEKRKTVRQLDIVFTDDCKRDNQKILNTFPLNIQRYVDEIADVGWTTETNYLRLTAQSFAELVSLDDSMDTYCFHLLQGCSVRLEDIINHRAIRSTLEKQSKTQDNTMLLVSQEPLQTTSIDSFLQIYPQTVVICFDSEAPDQETDRLQEKWRVYGLQDGNLEIQRHSNQSKARFATATHSLELNLIFKGDVLMGFESQISNRGIYKQQGASIRPVDRELAQLDQYGESEVEGRYNRQHPEDCEYGYKRSSNQEGIFRGRHFVMGTSCEHDIMLEVRSMFPRNDYTAQTLLTEKVCNLSPVEDVKVKMELVEMSTDTILGNLEREDGVKLQGYLDSGMQPTLAFQTEDGVTVTKPSKFADRTPSTRTIRIFEIGKPSISQIERVFLDNIVELCDFIGLPFVKNIKYSVIRKSCEWEKAQQEITQAMEECKKDDVCHLLAFQGSNDCLDWLSNFIQQKEPNPILSHVLRHKKALVVSDMRSNSMKDGCLTSFLEAIERADTNMGREAYLIRRGKQPNSFIVDTCGYVSLDVSLQRLNNGGILARFEDKTEAIILDGRVVTFGVKHD